MLDKLSNLHESCFPHKPWSANDFADLKKSGCEIIASDNGFVVFRVIADEAEIITIGVHPDARKTGIADAMLTIAENEIKKSFYDYSPPEGESTQRVGGGRIFLEVAMDNIAAIKLYEKHGYVQVGIRPKYYDGVDAIIMEKKL